MHKQNETIDAALAILTFVLMIVSLYLVFLWVPRERTMGDVQRIFYFHVSAAMTSFVAFFLVFIGSVGYLIQRDTWWDRIAACSAELGLLMIAITLLTGPIWAKPVWGIWWTWDMRLTTSLVLGLIYLAYLMLRAYVFDKEKRANLSAVVGIIGFLDVPLVYFSIRWWRTQHPSPVILGGEGSGLAPEMRLVMWFCVLTFVVLFSWLLRFRLRLQDMKEEADYLRETLFAMRGDR
jgi:heme exporter protein C